MLPSSSDLTPEEVAERTRKNVGAIQAALRRGQLRGYKVGSSWRVPLDALDEYCRPVEPPGERPRLGRRRGTADAAAERVRAARERLRARGMYA
jgi:excisionase family DNA binding protein